MPINFDLLQPQATPTQGVIANIPASSGGGDSGFGGIGEALSGLKSMIGNFGGGVSSGNTNPSSNMPSQTVPVSTSGIGSLIQSSINAAPITSSSGQSSLFGMTSQGNSTMSNIWSNASKELGFTNSNPTLQSFLSKANPTLNPQTTPWCAGFVGSVLNASGLKGTGSLAAKSYLNYGTPIQSPTQGDIVVFNDLTGRNDPNHGHVGFVQSIDQQKGVVSVLGGNQSGAVDIKQYPLSKVAGFRRPPTGEQISQFAKQNGIANPQQLANITQDDHPTLGKVMQGIAGVETGGEENPYTAISRPDSRGFTSLGKYQISERNLTSWSKESLGYPVTKQQFLSSPAIQEAIARKQINDLLQKGYSPQDVASIWFSGRPQKQAGNARDSYGTTVPQYIKSFNKHYLQVSYNTANQHSPMPLERENPQGVINPTPINPGYERLMQDLNSSGDVSEIG